MSCKHQWELLSQNTTEAKVELIQRLPNLEAENLNDKYLARKFIQLFKCTSCGKLKRFVEEI